MNLSFSDFSYWSFIIIVATLLSSMLLANILKHLIKPLRKTLFPTSVLGGLILLIISSIVFACTGKYLFQTPLYTGDKVVADGMNVLEMITYHCLAVGFIATGMRSSEKKFTGKRAVEIFDTGCNTVAAYLLQAFFGIIITTIAGLFIADMIDASGLILCFGFGQGTGQAMNYGSIYEEGYGFVGGKSFGLTIAAIGFLVACICGVVYLNVLKAKGKIVVQDKSEKKALSEIYEGKNDIPMSESMDKFTVQIAVILSIYAVSFGIIYGLSKLVPSLANVLYGFNFLIGTVLTIPVKAVIKALRKKNVIKHDYVNNFMMNRIAGFAFDLMIVAGIAAIQPHLIAQYWAVLLILAVFGTAATFCYVLFVSKKLFPKYYVQQFLAMFGMLTGTASTGMILLREVDPALESPVSENLVYQTLPAMVFGFPLMFLATYAPKAETDGKYITYIVIGIVAAFFVVLNVIMFRRKIFKKAFVKYDAKHGKNIDDESAEPATSATEEAPAAEINE